MVRSGRRFLIAVTAALFAACVSNPDGGCPRAGIDSPRRCKRLCVLSPKKGTQPMTCTCMAECLCWQMPGHSVSPQPEEASAGKYAIDLASEK